MSKLLDKARKYEEEHRAITDTDRPLFHLTPMTGWCNDPNGFSIYKGEYHLFYQYYPYDVIWGPMHWGHAKTSDFITWEHLPAVLAPDQPYDELGCFSGSALELEDGRHLIAYTGCYSGEMTPVDGSFYQHQCFAIGDGINYEKVENNPVISAEFLPEQYNNIDFRDPKLLKNEKGYSLVCSARRKDNSGHSILLYESQDLTNWTLSATLVSANDERGRMWECPDFFTVDGRDLLVFSPQLAYAGQKLHETLAFSGTFDRVSRQFFLESEIPLDYGTDFYAPQTLESLDGRRIMIGWMQKWASVDFKMTGQHFFGEMSLPRELYYKDDLLCQRPVRELENYYGENYSYHKLRVKDSLALDHVEGLHYDMTAEIHFDELPCNIRISLREGAGHSFDLVYNAEEGILRGDRSKAGIPEQYDQSSIIPVSIKNGTLKLRFIIDDYSVEVYVNDGEQVATYLISSKGRGITFYSEKESTFHVDFHTIENMR